MRTLSEWLDAYGESHQNSINRAIHHVCVPCIVWSLLGLLWFVPLPLEKIMPGSLGNVAVILVFIVSPYYFWLSWRIAIGAVLLFGLMLVSLYSAEKMGWPLLSIGIVVFVLAWIGQFIGHGIEGKRPSFVEDMRFLLIGPLWVISHVYNFLGIPLDAKAATD